MAGGRRQASMCGSVAQLICFPPINSKSGTVNDPSNYLKEPDREGKQYCSPSTSTPPNIYLHNSSPLHRHLLHPSSWDHARTPARLLFHSRRRLSESLCCKRGTCFISRGGRSDQHGQRRRRKTSLLQHLSRRDS